VHQYSPNGWSELTERSFRADDLCSAVFKWWDLLPFSLLRSELAGDRVRSVTNKEYSNITKPQLEGWMHCMQTIGLRSLRALSLLILVIGICHVSLNAQNSYGSISGLVTDQGGGVVPGAKITATNVKNNISSDVVSGSAGQFTFPTLEPGIYTVNVEAPGFGKQEIKGNRVDVASSVTLNFSLTPGSVSQIVEVSATAETLERSTAELGSTLGQQQLTELPTNGRDYGRFSLQTPGAVATSKSIASLAFNGQQVVQNAFTIDGVDATRVDEPYMANGNERGARLLTGSLETLSEFKIQTDGANAQYGRAAAASMNIVTRSGGSQFHGTVYDYFRNDALDARNYFARQGLVSKPPFHFNDFGGAISGPLFGKKTFFFLNYEGDRQIIGTTATGTVPSALLRSQVLAASPALAPILNLMPLGQSPSGDAAGDVDNYTTIAPSTVQEDTGSVRIDHHFSEADSMFARVNINNSFSGGSRASVYPNSFGPLDFQKVPIRVTNIAVHEAHITGANFFNDVLLGMQRVATGSNTDNGFPATTITNLTISVGSTAITQTNSTLFQAGDNMTLLRGKHTLIWGGSFYYIRVFNNGSASQSMSYTSIPNFISNSLASVSVSAADVGHVTLGQQYGAFAQDTWRFSKELTFNFGIRWDFEPPIHDAKNSTQTFDPRINALAPPGTSYYDSDPTNFAPRLGVAWSPLDRVVFRSSYGLFYILQPVGNATYSLPLNNVKGNISLSNTTTPGLTYPFTSYVAQAQGTQNTAYGFLRHLPDAYAEQWNFSMQNQLDRNSSITLAYVGNHGVNQMRYRDINLKNVALGARPISGFGDVYLQGMDGQSSYNAFQASFLHRSTSGLVAQANYTWAHGIGDVPDGSNSTSTSPQNLADLAAERGNGAGDVRHNFSANALYPIPMGEGHSFLGAGSRPIKLISSGWQLSGGALVHSGVVGNVTITQNTSGDGNLVNQRPNLVPGQSLYLPNKSFRGFLNPNAFSLPTAGTFGNAPRNEFYGPRFTELDTALEKITPLGESRSLEFRAEFFNVLNHPIFGAPVSTYSPTSATFGQIISAFGGSVGIGTARNIEFALRYQF
jgi:hypothetical protein